jgi:DNA-binding transcriptional MerR regulator
MEIKNRLLKPYTDKQKMDFIVQQNHTLGYEIRETSEALEAWGYTEEELEEQKRQTQISEINSKIKELEAESVYDMLYNNSSNVDVYKNIIKGLEETKNSLNT